MSVSKRNGSPFYWYDFTVGGLRFRGSTETDDAATARTIEASLRREAALNQHLKRKPRITLDAAFAKYWKEHGQFLPSAWRVIDFNSRQMLTYFGKNTFLDELTDNRINDFIAHLRVTPIGQPDGKQKQITPGAINRKLDVLGAVLGRAARWNVELPEIKISSHKLIAAEARTRWITPEEAGRLIENAAPHVQPILRCALLTGLRFANITGLTWEQVNMHARVIRVRVKSKLPGGKQLEIPISDALFSLLLEQGPQKSGPVFMRRFKPHRKTGKKRKPMPIGQLRNSFRHACEKSGIEDFRFHDLRHTAASWMLQNGVPLDVVQQILGHAHISQTQKYAHRQASDRQAAMNALAMAQPQQSQQKGKAA